MISARGNDIGHGRSIKVAEDQIDPLGKGDDWMRGFAQTGWEKSGTRKNAERARRDVEPMVKALHAKTDIKDEFQLVGGFQEAARLC